ncbi:MAG: RcpC/CpaB family pilus assembly protein [Anaerolineaceae bacterium]
MNRTVQFIIGVIAVVVALGAGFYGRNLYLKEVSTYQVPVPINAIPAYAILDTDMFQMREMPRTMASLPYYQSTQDLEGKISTVSLPAELPIAQANALPVTQFRLADAAFEVLSIPVEPVSAVGGQIRIGEHVNLYQVLPEEIDPENTAISATDLSTFKVDLIARSVLVVDVRNAQGVAAESNQTSEDNSTFGGSPQNEQVQILTLAVEPKDVDVILTAVAASKKQGGLLWSTLALP